MFPVGPPFRNYNLPIFCEKPGPILSYDPSLAVKGYWKVEENWDPFILKGVCHVIFDHPCPPDRQADIFVGIWFRFFTEILKFKRIPSVSCREFLIFCCRKSRDTLFRNADTTLSRKSTYLSNIILTPWAFLSAKGQCISWKVKKKYWNSLSCFIYTLYCTYMLTVYSMYIVSAEVSFLKKIPD